jgi:hypothetical protein
MSTKFARRSSFHDLIDDIVESPPSSYPTRTTLNRTYSAYSSLPSSLHKQDNLPTKITNEHRDRSNVALPRSNSSLIMMNNDERRKEIDLIIKQLYDGKLMTNDHSPSDVLQSSTHILNKEPLTTTTIKTDKQSKNNVANIDVSECIN